MSTRQPDDLSFRDPERADRLTDRLGSLVDAVDTPLRIIHVCGSHEEAIAEYGIRSVLPEGLSVTMGPGCPVCVTQRQEIDEAVALARDGCVVVTYGDMVDVPGTSESLADARADGADVRVVYSAAEAAEIAATTDRLLRRWLRDDGRPDRDRPPGQSAVEPLGAVGSQVHPTSVGRGRGPPEHAGRRVPRRRACRDDYRNRAVRVGTASARPPGRRGRLRTARRTLRTRPVGRVYQRRGPTCRELALSDDYRQFDAREQFDVDVAPTDDAGERCLCGEIMAGRAEPTDCPLLGDECTPEAPVGACMVSDEGPCRIAESYGEVRQP